MSTRRGNTPATCAVCGTALSPSARACPECGADERTGWSETSVYDGLDLPDDPEDVSGRPKAVSAGMPWYWLAIAVLLLFLLGFAALGLL